MELGRGKGKLVRRFVIYLILPAVIMDAIDESLERGKSIGFAEGEARGKSLGLIEGKAEGSRQKALETARILKQLGDSTQKIVQATGLPLNLYLEFRNLCCKIPNTCLISLRNLADFLHGAINLDGTGGHFLHAGSDNTG